MLKTIITATWPLAAVSLTPTPAPPPAADYATGMYSVPSANVTKYCADHSEVCLKLHVTRPAAGVTGHPASTPPSTPAPPPACHYESFFTYSTPTAVQSNGAATQQIDYQREVCPTGAPDGGPPIKLVPVVPDAPVVSEKALADEAYARMVPPVPQIVMTPAADTTQLVSLPIWLQVARSSWAPKSEAVSAGGVSLTMNAAPVSAVWSMGDGTTETCRGPGTPYPAVKPKDPMIASPDCGHVYAAPSESLPQGSYPVSVTTHWKVTWSTTTGLSGTEPDLTAIALTRLRVAEIQALVTKVGS